MQTTIGLNTDFQQGLIDRFRSLPIARSAVAGGIVADVLRTGWGTVIIVAVGARSGSGCTPVWPARPPRSA
jgi:ABC-2 type transport system permease protein